MRKIFLMTTVLLSIVRGLFAIEPEAAKAYQPIIVEMLTGRFQAPAKPQNQSFSPIVSAGPIATPLYNNYSGKWESPKSDTKGTTAVINIEGAIMKNDNCGAPGTKTMASWLQAVENNPNFIGAVIICDSPGGDVSGTDLLANQIKNMSKPVATVVNGLCCSAAYWIASASDTILSDSSNNTIGSIGTYCTLQDWSGYMEKMGVKLIEVYATQSTEKNKIYKDAMAGDTSGLTDQVTAINNNFLSAVRSNRYSKKMKYSEAFTGRTYQSQDAIDSGLIDGMGTLDDAISFIQKQSRS